MTTRCLKKWNFHKTVDGGGSCEKCGNKKSRASMLSSGLRSKATSWLDNEPVSTCISVHNSATVPNAAHTIGPIHANGCKWIKTPVPSILLPHPKNEQLGRCWDVNRKPMLGCFFAIDSWPIRPIPNSSPINLGYTKAHLQRVSPASFFPWGRSCSWTNADLGRALDTSKPPRIRSESLEVAHLKMAQTAIKM
jgi:hypothetical protein